MLRIETKTDGPQMILRLIGRVRCDCIEDLRQRVQNQASFIVLDLADVELVDLRQFVSCAIAKTLKSNYGFAHHTFWSGFAASALRSESDRAIAEKSAIAEAPKPYPEPIPAPPTYFKLVLHLQS
jgi:hypothetical protein